MYGNLYGYSCARRYTIINRTPDATLDSTFDRTFSIELFRWRALLKTAPFKCCQTVRLSENAYCSDRLEVALDSVGKCVLSSEVRLEVFGIQISDSSKPPPVANSPLEFGTGARFVYCNTHSPKFDSKVLNQKIFCKKLISVTVALTISRF